MPLEVTRILWRISRIFQIASMVAFAALALASSAGVFVFATGLAPWPVLLLQLGSGGWVNVAPALIGAGFVVAVLFLAYMPSHWRMLALENGHRSFRMRMEDVTQAYMIAHQGDRSGLFETASEFDAVRDRILFLRDHPDLGELEPDVMDVAAQMSRVSEELATRYSDDKVARAQGFLAERRAEAVAMDARIEDALDVTRRMRRLIEAVEMEERVATSRLEQLRDELDRLLPSFDLAPTAPARSAQKASVVQLALAGGRTRAKA